MTSKRSLDRRLDDIERVEGECSLSIEIPDILLTAPDVPPEYLPPEERPAEYTPIHCQLSDEAFRD